MTSRKNNKDRKDQGCHLLPSFFTDASLLNDILSKSFGKKESESPTSTPKKKKVPVFDKDAVDEYRHHGANTNMTKFAKAEQEY
ncbi:2792_t:CDS:2, partial [Dentiscutata heterogama]